MKIYINNLKTENEILKRLLKDGFILINYDSLDCDGCSTSKVLRFHSLDEIYKAIEQEQDYTDGKFSYSIPEIYPDGSLCLNEYYNGGSW